MLSIFICLDLRFHFFVLFITLERKFLAHEVRDGENNWERLLTDARQISNADNMDTVRRRLGPWETTFKAGASWRRCRTLPDLNAFASPTSNGLRPTEGSGLHKPAAIAATLTAAAAATMPPSSSSQTSVTEKVRGFIIIAQDVAVTRTDGTRGDKERKRLLILYYFFCIVSITIPVLCAVSSKKKRIKPYLSHSVTQIGRMQS